MSLKALGETARFINGAAFKPTDWSDGGLPIIRIQNLTGTGEKFNYTTRKVKPELVVASGDLLVSWSATLDVYRWAGPRGLLNQHIFKVLPKPGVDPDYLYYALKSALAELSAKTHGSTMKHVVRGDFESTRVHLPSLPEQRHIVDLISRADGIVRLRREAEKKAAELIPAQFLDMFGDPAANPKGWPVRKVADFVSRFEGGKNIQAGSENGSAYRILKVSAATSGVYRESESKPAPDGYNPPLSHIVKAGDMLFSRANTEELVGATAIVGSTDGKTLLPDKLWRFVWAEPVDPAYMHALFQSSRVRRELGKLSSGTSASMRNISQGKLFGLSLPVAPYAKQKAFGERAAAILSIQSQQSAATAKTQATFDALLAEAFTANHAPQPLI